MDVYDSGKRLLDSKVKYDLVFLDIVMEGLNGIETARRLRERDMGCLIVFLTEFQRICVGCLSRYIHLTTCSSP